jgi:hypothetical protein
MSTPTLHDLARKFYDLAPWEIWEETDIIRLIHPQTGETAHISIMGQNGQHTALALYIGYEAFQRFNLMQEDDPFDPEFPEEDNTSLMLETRQLQLCFGSRNELMPDELNSIKKLGLKFRGENWPMFRSFKPGYAPTTLDEAEIFWLTLALEQFLELSPLWKKPPVTTFRIKHDNFDILTRICTNGIWQSTWTEHDGISFEWPTPEPSGQLIEKIKQHRKLVDVECHFQLLPALIGPKSKAIFPYIAISVDAKSGFILGMELLSVEKQTHQELIDSVPDVFLKQWDKAAIRPASIRVRSITSYSMLEIAAADLNTPLRRADRLPNIDHVLDNLPI